MRITELALTVIAAAALSSLAAAPATAATGAPAAQTTAAVTTTAAAPSGLLPIDPIGTVCGLLPGTPLLCTNGDPWEK